MRIIPIFLALLLCGASSDSTVERLARGRELVAAGQYDSAVAEFEAVLKEEPLNGTALFSLGSIYGNYLGNEELRDEYWRKYKAATHASLAEVAVEEEDLEGAAGHYRDALAVLPDSGFLHEQLGALYKRMGKGGEALDEFRAAADLNSEDLQLQLALWEYLSREGKGEESAKYLERALEIRPRDAKLRRVAQAFFTKLGDDEKAREQVVALALAGLATPEEYCGLGKLYVGRGELDKAERALFRGYGQKTRDECLAAAADLGRAWSGKGKHDRAARVYRVMLERGGPDARTYNMLLVTYQKMGKLDAAAGVAEKAVAAFPGDAPLRNNLATLYALRREYARAVAEYRRALAIDPSLAGIYLDMGIIYKDYLGDREKAVDSFQKYVTLKPEGRKDPEVIKLLGFED